MGAIPGERLKGGFLEKEVIWTESLGREEIAMEEKVNGWRQEKGDPSSSCWDFP